MVGDFTGPKKFTVTALVCGGSGFKSQEISLGITGVFTGHKKITISFLETHCVCLHLSLAAKKVARNPTPTSGNSQEVLYLLLAKAHKFTVTRKAKNSRCVCSKIHFPSQETPSVHDMKKQPSNLITDKSSLECVSFCEDTREVHRNHRICLHNVVFFAHMPSQHNFFHFCLSHHFRHTTRVLSFAPS